MSEKYISAKNLPADLTAGVVVFLVALPLCLGIALASGAPLFSGLLAGIIGGLIVGSISGSHTSVSGPAAGLTAVVLAQVAILGDFRIFLLAVAIAGVMQIGLGIAKAGALSAFFPSSVIKGLLAAIGVILILKQFPHVLGHDNDPEGEMSFSQPDQENTFSELLTVFLGDIHFGAAVIGLSSIALLLLWERVKFLKATKVPGPLAVVLMGVGLQVWFAKLGGQWLVGPSHLVQIPVAETPRDLINFLQLPDFSQWTNPSVYIAGATIAIVASLETLLNLEAVDKLDKLKRNSPGSRELIAQGVGNVVGGMIGALPVTSVIVRSSVNVNTGAKSKVSAIFHGLLLIICVGLFPAYLNMIPLAALAAILLVTGTKLASPALFRQMWSQGRYQFAPFIITLVAIVFTDLLVGILIGLAVAVLFILNSNLRKPIRRVVETHLGGDVLHVELSPQVSFLNRAALHEILWGAPKGSNLLIDASESDYIDPDVLSMIREFKTETAPARDINVSLRGFRDKYQLHDEIQFADYSTRDLQASVTPKQVLEILREGNRRFRTGNRLTRDFNRQVDATATEQNPLACVLSCIDSRVPAELIFDLGIGDMFSVRVAGNVIGTKTIGSIEYGVAVAGVKCVVVMGHTHCGPVHSAVELLGEKREVEQATGCAHLPAIMNEITRSIHSDEVNEIPRMDSGDREKLVDEVSRRNIDRTVNEIVTRSEAVRKKIESGELLVVGALYDVRSGEIEFLHQPSGAQEMVA